MAAAPLCEGPLVWPPLGAPLVPWLGELGATALGMPDVPWPGWLGMPVVGMLGVPLGPIEWLEPPGTRV